MQGMNVIKLLLFWRVDVYFPALKPLQVCGLTHKTMAAVALMHDICHRCVLPFTEISQHEMKVQDTTAHVLCAVDAKVSGLLQTNSNESFTNQVQVC